MTEREGDMARMRRRRIEALEHEALEPRSWRLWGHRPDCVACVMLRVSAGETTMDDHKLRDAQGRQIVMSGLPEWLMRAVRD